MRCIEILMNKQQPEYQERLTLTWDVLKYWLILKKEQNSWWLTLTWDVLKFPGCRRLKKLLIRLTLTWDVLKFSRMELLSHSLFD